MISYCYWYLLEDKQILDEFECLLVVVVIISPLFTTYELMTIISLLFIS